MTSANQIRQNITFSSCSNRCAGWSYVPQDGAADAQYPVIILAHGFSAVKEQGLANYAERFCSAGFAVVVFDFAHFGASEGAPLGQLFPHDMVEDYRNAITWACQQPQVDPSRLGLWGTSFSGGVATFAATVDRRAKAVVAQVPSLMNAETRRAPDPAKWAAVGQMLVAERAARYRAGEVRTMPVVAPMGQPCVLPGRECLDAFEAFSTVAPNWRNEITIASLEKIREFDPVSLIQMLAPTTLLVIAAETDSLIPLAAVTAAFDRAAEPKRMVVLPTGHFDIYSDPWLTKSVDEAIDWFSTHLGRR